MVVLAGSELEPDAIRFVLDVPILVGDENLGELRDFSPEGQDFVRQSLDLASTS